VPTAELFLDARSILCESPVWDADAAGGAGELLWADITPGVLHRTAVDGSADRTSTLPPPLPSFQRRRGGGLVAALQDRIVLVDDDGGHLEELARVEHAHPGIRFNEGKCDPFGNFVVGGMDATKKAPDAGLYRITPEGEVTVLRGGFGTCNGIEFDDDGHTMWVTDTAVQTIFRAPYDENGALGEFEPWSVGHRHDGLVRDSTGDFWGAIYGAGQVLHLDAAGRILETVDVPAPNVTGITIGGRDLTTLFIGTARENATEEQLQAAPLSGGVFTYELDRPGLPARLFG
jgi:sugar lactone lactonase YvrE